MLAVYDSETRGVTQATSCFYQHSTIVAYQIYPKTNSRGVWILQCRDIYVNAKMWILGSSESQRMILRMTSN